jgi:hypothetical protein
LIFQKAVNLITNKKHLTEQGRLYMIKYYNELKVPITNAPLHNNIKITNFWLGGFVDGDGTFSTNKQVPRFKLENHYKELNLFHKINFFFNDTGKVRVTKSRKNKINSKPTVVLEFNQISFLKNVIIPTFFDETGIQILQTKKVNDFYDWCTLINIYYFGYHLIPEGILIIKIIKQRMNKVEFQQQTDPEITLFNLFNIPSPYEIKNGIRFLRGTNNLVSESLHLIVVDIFGNCFAFKSITECSTKLNIERSIIKKCLLTGEMYNEYKFLFTGEK